MSTLPTDAVLTPVGEGFGKKRFIGLEIETTRSEAAFPKPAQSTPWDIRSWSLSTRAINHIKKTLDPEDRFIAMVGKDGDDIEVTTQPLSENALKFQAGTFLRNIQLTCVACDASGTHIHISKLPTDKKHLWANLYWFQTVFDKQFIAIFRRDSNWAESPRKHIIRHREYLGLGNKVSLKELEKKYYPNGGGKHCTIVQHASTYECRAGAASTSPKEIKAWALLFKNIVDFCNRGSIVGHRFEEVIPNDEYGSLIKSRLTGEQLRQIVPIDLYL